MLLVLENELTNTHLVPRDEFLVIVFEYAFLQDHGICGVLLLLLLEELLHAQVVVFFLFLSYTHHRHFEVFVFLDIFIRIVCYIEYSEKMVSTRLSLNEVFNVNAHFLNSLLDHEFSVIVELEVGVQGTDDVFLALRVLNTGEVVADLLLIFFLGLD